MAVTLFSVNKGYYDDVPVEKALAFEVGAARLPQEQVRGADGEHREDEGPVGRRREGARRRDRRLQEERRVLRRRRHYRSG